MHSDTFNSGRHISKRNINYWSVRTLVCLQCLACPSKRGLNWNKIFTELQFNGISITKDAIEIKLAALSLTCNIARSNTCAFEDMEVSQHVGAMQF